MGRHSKISLSYKSKRRVEDVKLINCIKY